VVRVGSMRNTYEILIGKPEQSSSLGRHGRGQEGNSRLQRPVDFLTLDTDPFLVLMYTAKSFRFYKRQEIY
jgi:hypothetical protein